MPADMLRIYAEVQKCFDRGVNVEYAEKVLEMLNAAIVQQILMRYREKK